jgi:hypothetical protein
MEIKTIGQSLPAMPLKMPKLTKKKIPPKDMNTADRSSMYLCGIAYKYNARNANPTDVGNVGHIYVIPYGTRLRLSNKKNPPTNVSRTPGKTNTRASFPLAENARNNMPGTRTSSGHEVDTSTSMMPRVINAKNTPATTKSIPITRLGVIFSIVLSPIRTNASIAIPQFPSNDKMRN